MNYTVSGVGLKTRSLSLSKLQPVVAHTAYPAVITDAQDHKKICKKTKKNIDLFKLNISTCKKVNDILLSQDRFQYYTSKVILKQHCI